uniref:Tail tape measure protein n=1 Tax=Siphoviridae sp. ctRg61 TaxID=2826335 RepID=A0A8S5LUY2_9CAUD|nr:MAG TPA: tail tape measure protein [Siphoviridae sp. ctRg61]
MAKIGIDTTGVQNGLTEADSAMRAFSREMREVNNVIAQGGNSAEMAAQRNQLYAEQITQLNRRLEALRSVEEDINRARANGNIDESEYRAYRREIEQTENALQNLREQQRDIGANAGKDYDKVVSALQNVEKVALATTGAVAAALGKLSSDALSAYSQYEQLVGGIETLFAGAEDIVLENAENAFKTAGVSANNYMQTVTSFSATLLQGLDGDTEKAARIADQALIDMADNANKMGTAMGSIQYAYQGFAKQNFTMLDNLKLGYGGSQAEMARLINDSGVLNGEIIATAENVKQIPFDKIIEAIHVIQTNLGITGTTALEAETTLEGSMNKLKASWENALVDIARPLDDFAQGGLTILNDNIDTIKEALVQMMEKIKPLLDDALVKLQAFIDSGGVEKLADGFVDLVTFIVNQKDVILGVFAALEVALGADRITKAVKGIKELKDAISGVASVANAATGGIEAFGIGLSGWILVAGAAALAAAEVASGLNSIADAMTRVNMETKKSDDNVKNMSDRWNGISEMESGLDKYNAASDMLDDIMASEEEWNSRYKKTIDELNVLQEKKFKTSDETARMKELQKQKDSLDAEYAALQLYHTKCTNEINKYDAQTLVSLERSAEAQANAQANAGKTNKQAVEDAWAKIRETTKAKMDELDDQLATHKIDDNTYWAQRKAYLEAHRDEESEEWWKYYDAVTDHYDKLSKTEKTAADKSAKEAETALKDSYSKRYEALKRQQKENGYGDSWLADELKKMLSELTEGSELYNTYYDKWLDLTDKISDATEKATEKEVKEWKTSSDKVSDAVEKKYEQVQKAFEKAKSSYISALDLSASKKAEDDVYSRLGLARPKNGEESADSQYDFSSDTIAKQTKELDEYTRNMERLEKSDIPEEYLENIRSMSFDKRKEYVKELLKLSPERLKKHYADISKYYRSAEKAGRSDTQSLRDDADKAAEEAKNTIKTSLDGLSSNAYESGKAAAEAYWKGFKEYKADTDKLMGVTSAGSGGSTSSAAAVTPVNLTINVNGKQVATVNTEDYLNRMKNEGGVIDV